MLYRLGQCKALSERLSSIHPHRAVKQSARLRGERPEAVQEKVLKLRVARLTTVPSAGSLSSETNQRSRWRPAFVTAQAGGLRWHIGRRLPILSIDGELPQAQECTAARAAGAVPAHDERSIIASSVLTPEMGVALQQMHPRRGCE